MPIPEGFKDWKRDDQLAYIYANYGGSVEDRQRAAGGNNVLASGRFRAHNVATAPYVSDEERSLWSMVKPDSGTFVGGLFRDIAPAALAAGLIYAGGTALAQAGGAGAGAGAAGGAAGGGAGAGAGAAGGGVGAGGIGAGFGTNAGGLGIFAGGGAGGIGGLGGGGAGLLAGSGAIAGGAGIGGTSGALGTLGGLGGTGGSMSWMDWVPSLISAGSSLIGGKKAGDATARAQREATAEQRRQFDLVRSDTAGQRALGNAAIDRLGRLYGYGAPTANGAPTSVAPDMSAFFESPDYQFNLAETQNAVNRSKSAQGGLLSGAAVREGERYAANLASREYGSFIDRLMQQAGIGSTGIGASAAAGANAANNIGSYAMNAGNNRANIYQNTAANVNNSIQTGIGNAMLRRYLGQT